MIIADTPRLFIRQFHLFDQTALEAVFCDPEVMRYGPGVQSREWIAAWLRDCLDCYFRKYGFGPWAVVAKSTREVIGYCGLFVYPDIAGKTEIEIGYRLGRACWGHGYATEAAAAVRDYSFNVLSLARLVALIDPHNKPSRRVAEKLGMRDEREVMLPGYTYPDHLYALARPGSRALSAERSDHS